MRCILERALALMEILSYLEAAKETAGTLNLSKGLPSEKLT